MVVVLFTSTIKGSQQGLPNYPDSSGLSSLTGIMEAKVIEVKSNFGVKRFLVFHNICVIRRFGRQVFAVMAAFAISDLERTFQF